MLKKFRSIVRSSQSKDDLSEKHQTTNDKVKRKFIDLFRSASDQELETDSKSNLFSRRNMKSHINNNGMKKRETNGSLKDQTGIPVVISCQDECIEKFVTDDASSGISPNPPMSNALEKKDLENNNNVNELLTPLLHQEDESSLRILGNPSNAVHRPISVDRSYRLPTASVTWKRTKEKNEDEIHIEERCKRKGDKRKHFRRAKQEGGKEEKVEKHERSENKSRSMERCHKESRLDHKQEQRQHRKLDETGGKYLKQRDKSDSEKPRHHHRKNGDSQPWLENEREHHHRHKSSDKQTKPKQDVKDNDNSRRHKEKYSQQHREKRTNHDNIREKRHEKIYSGEHKRIEFDTVWREFESGKRYYSIEKDMRKVVDRLDGVERYRREERQRSTDRSRGFSSDTSCDLTHRSLSRERRRRSKSRGKNEQDYSQGFDSWQYSLGRIEARQEQCKVEIDTARRSIEHRIKQLEARLEKQYSSLENLAGKTTGEKLDECESQDIKKMIEKVADECREVTRTLEVRTEEMKTEIASVVREEFSNMDEKMSFGHKSPGSPISFCGMQADELTSIPNKLIDNVTKSLTSIQPVSSSDDCLMMTEKNNKANQSSVRVSQSGALDREHGVPLEGGDKDENIVVPLEPPDCPLNARSMAFEKFYELSIQSLEEEECFGEYDGSSIIAPEAVN